MPKLALNGGSKSFKKELPMQQYITKDEYLQVKEVLKSKLLSGFLASPGENFFGGPKTKYLEKQFREKFSVKYAHCIQSATAGIHAALSACNLEPGDEVIVTPYSMVASVSAVIMNNNIPRFADVDTENFCLDPMSILKNINKNTKAIIVVHLFGYPAPMDEIMNIARKYKLYVIEDCAQSINAIYKKKFTGTIGDIGVFSFNQNKTITTGEGGVVVTNNSELSKRLCLIRNHGEVVLDHFKIKKISGLVGYNYRMTELEAAVGIAQFKKLDFLTKYKQNLAEYLTKDSQNILFKVTNKRLFEMLRKLSFYSCFCLSYDF